MRLKIDDKIVIGAIILTVILLILRLFVEFSWIIVFIPLFILVGGVILFFTSLLLILWLGDDSRDIDP